MALHTGDSLWSQVLMCFAGLGIGATVGAINGFFIAYGRLQPVVVTLAVMFIILGLNLLLMPDPGGYIPYGLSMVFTGDLIPDGFPAALLVILLALGLWALIKRSRFGTALYAVGSNEGRRLRQRHLGRADQVLRLHAGRHLLRRGRGLPQRPDQLRRPAGGQRHAAPHLRRYDPRRHTDRRRARAAASARCSRRSR